MFGEGRLVGVSATWLEHALDRLAMVIIVLLIFLTFLGPSPVSQPSPNLEVTGELYLRRETLNIAGNVTVRSGGRLLLINSTLRFVGDGRHFFVVEVGGELFLNRSTVTGPEGSYTIFVERGAKFSAVYSVIENAGWKDHREDGNYIWIGPAFTVDYSTYGHGLEVNTTVKLFRGNTLRNIASVRFYSSGNVIEDNLLVNMRHEGIAFVGSNDNVVKGNTFRDAALNRETYGLKFYPGTKNQLIANNTFQNLSIGIFVSLVPPWKAGENFTITGNRMRQVVQGLVAKLRDSVVKGEDYRNLWSVGVFLAASQNVAVEDCTIENLTLYDESIASEEYFQEAKPLHSPQAPQSLLHLPAPPKRSDTDIVVRQKHNDTPQQDSLRAALRLRSSLRRKIHRLRRENGKQHLHPHRGLPAALEHIQPWLGKRPARPGRLHPAGRRHRIGKHGKPAYKE